MYRKNHLYTLSAIVCFIFLIPALSVAASPNWYALGAKAAIEAFALIKKSPGPGNGEIIVLTNAGYAEVSGQSTNECLDGLSRMTGAERGNNTLIEIHSSYVQPLWFAVYHKRSGRCAYLQLDPEPDEKWLANPFSASASDIFGIMSAEKIQAAYLYANPEEFGEKFTQKVFGGNEFRIVTITNAIAAGAPAYAVRSFEFHDHYCPGVTSGILMVNYIKKHFVKDAYFVQAVSPWCKEDALMVLLNATPGKSGYSVTYPNDEDKAKWKEGFETAATIVYGQSTETGKWEGILLGFEWGQTACPEYGDSTINKLCSDLYYLDRLNTPESYVKVLKRFELPEGETPKDWARPGIDPMVKLGLTEE